MAWWLGSKMKWINLFSYLFSFHFQDHCYLRIILLAFSYVLELINFINKVIGVYLLSIKFYEGKKITFASLISLLNKEVLHYKLALSCYSGLFSIATSGQPSIIAATPFQSTLWVGPLLIHQPFSVSPCGQPFNVVVTLF